jgi:hypothetical protein
MQAARSCCCLSATAAETAQSVAKMPLVVCSLVVLRIHDVVLTSAIWIFTWVSIRLYAVHAEAAAFT